MENTMKEKKSLKTARKKIITSKGVIEKPTADFSKKT